MNLFFCAWLVAICHDSAFPHTARCSCIMLPLTVCGKSPPCFMTKMRSLAKCQTDSGRLTRCHTLLNAFCIEFSLTQANGQSPKSQSSQHNSLLGVSALSALARSATARSTALSAQYTQVCMCACFICICDAHLSEAHILLLDVESFQMQIYSEECSLLLIMCSEHSCVLSS